MGTNSFQHFSPKPIDKKKLSKQLSSLLVFDKPRQRAAHNPATRRKWIKNIKAVKPGTHPLDKKIIELAAKAGKKATNLHNLLIFCETQLTNSKVPFSRGALEVRLSVLMDHKLIADIRAMNPKAPKVIKKKAVVPKVDISKLKSSPFYKTWHVYGNSGLVNEYKKQQEQGNTSAMKEIENLIIGLNPKRSIEQLREMLLTQKR